MERRLLALDTEDDGNAECGIINFYDGRVHTTFTGPDLRLRAWNWLCEQAPAMVWACNVEYDLINLCGPWIGKMCTLNYVTAGLRSASWRRAKGIVFYDTMRHWAMSVAQMGRYIGLPKFEKNFTSIRYCRRDTEIVWRFVAEMLQRYEALDLRLRSTLPSMALQFFKHFCPDLPRVTDEARAFYRRGYYGGRVEVYRFQRIPTVVHHYDVNSLFPKQMRDGVYPDLGTWRETTTPDFGLEGMADVTVTVPPTRYPGLPMRHDGELVYPYGRLHGTWAYPELRQVLTDGGTIDAVHRAIECRPLPVSPFKSYVEYCYAARLKATHELDRVYWKLMMNSLYGKFGQREAMSMIFRDRLIERSKPAAHANVLWAAYVTSEARLHLLRELRACSDVYYTDTDSLFTPDRRPTSKALGDLKDEGSYGAHVLEFIGNKLYIFHEPPASRVYDPTKGWICPVCHLDGPKGTCEHAKAKGVPRDAAPDFLRTGRAIYRRPARFREARRSFATANTWYDVEKVRDDLYTKRRVFHNGTTEPWEWREYQRAREEARHG